MYIGEFTIISPGRGNQLCRNKLTKQGATLYLELLFQATASLPASVYMGLTGAALDYDSDLADAAAAEPAGNGYARQAIVRSNAGWTVEEVNGVMRARSVVKLFTATGNYDKTWSRAFLCDQAAGTAGNLIAAGGPTQSPIQTLNGLGPSVDYVANLNG